MLHRARKVLGAHIRAVDGDIGTLEDFFFEEDGWTVRYLLVDTGKWMSGRKVLLPPAAVTGPWN
ncbi:MAG TPA: PRC-barrel domain-containing protein, partial [Vicinamibacterales bacterium]